ncbi:peptide chain release factor N(5)-glutamine methyltransferase [Plebeiibacterium sediminum]|uniref:Release factor glutamine methyltransferase n=1 Tax=Plebeiibacterium sediminum TaxID=2992112 RepID=A0AAE3M0I8_9BACT|nr:peptide chain release factor N(5)-glutamine methyltransferase [Plebeiobacterium sediminum]MCW3784856.1 peptide chain release factor N(5)-glutamine methyltransferase [Plebeiobacterium sediminum]
MSFKNIRQLTTLFQSELKEIYAQEEIRNFIALIFDYKLSYSKVDLLMKQEDELAADIILFCEEALEKLKNHIPIQYIFGETEFYGLKFNVNPAVLIPRPETEELVHWIIEDCKTPDPEMLDIGTGSGCIPITLKKNIPDAKVKGWDISDEALTTARSNAALNNVMVDFCKQNALELKDVNEAFDIIVSNPPYVLEKEKELMHDNVLNNEPHLALFVPDNQPLLFYHAIAEFAKSNLKPSGKLYFEINEAFGDETVEMMEQLGFENIVLKKDLFGKDRMVRGEVN